MDGASAGRGAAEEFLDEVREVLRAADRFSAPDVEVGVALTEHWWVRLSLARSSDLATADAVLSTLEEHGLSAVPADGGEGTVVELLARGQGVKVIENA